MKEDERQVPLGKQVVVERETPEGEELASNEGLPSSSIEEGSQNKRDVVEDYSESHMLVESKADEPKPPAEESSKCLTEERLSSISGAPMDESKEKLEEVEGINTEDQHSGSDIRLHETQVICIDQRQETVKSSTEPPIELKATSDIFVEQEPGAKTYFETFSKSHEEDLPQTQSYYELSTAAETKLSGETGIIKKQLDEQQDKTVRISPSKMSLEQRSLSLNITVGSSEGHEVKEEKARTFSESLCPVTENFDESTPSLESHECKFLQEASLTPATSESPKDIHMKTETPQLSDKHISSFEQSSSLSEMLDLAGALPLPSHERREVDHMRRKSVPVDVSALVGSSLAKLAIRDQTSRVVGGGSQLEELGYCVFNEYLGPMPSPADVPSPGDSPHQHFPSMESEVEEELGATETEGIEREIQQPDVKGSVTEISQKKITEKKDSSVKTSLILEKAVTSGVKPDRLRIPMTSSKDRLTGLPGDIKIQVIPEVDIEKDPSREASPIPPDNSFTFTPSETGSQVPLTPTTPKSPEETLSESQDNGEKCEKDVIPEVRPENELKCESIDSKQPELDKEMPTAEQKEFKEASKEPEKANTDIPSASLQSSGKSVDKDDSEIQSKDGTSAKLEGIKKQDTLKALQDLSTEKPLDNKGAQINLQEVTLQGGSPKPQISSPIIIIPQAQVEEEVEDEDDIEIAEEPQEIMDEAEKPALTKIDQGGVGKLKQKKEEVRLMVGDQMLEEDQRSGAEEWSHSALNSDDGEPATDSSHLSPCSDHDLPTEATDEGGKDKSTAEDSVAEEPQINREEGKKSEYEVVDKDQTGKGDVDKVGSDEVCEAKDEKIMKEEDEGEEKDFEICQEVEETQTNVVCQTSQAANDETTMDVSVLDTDSGWMDSQGT